MIDYDHEATQLPVNRYEHDQQLYKFDEETEVVVECSQETNWLCNIEQLGISAGFIYIDDAAVQVRGKIRVPAINVEHRPTEGERGLITIDTE